MQVRRWEALGRTTLAVACGVASLFTAHTASARASHHHWRHNHGVHQLAPPAPQTLSIEALTALGPTAPGVSSIVINASSGMVVSENNADIPRFPASLTKLMTLDLAFQALRDGRLTLDTVLPVSAHASAVEPVKLGLMPGDTLTVRQAILAMTTMSANDAATALGEYLGGGSEDRCGQMMTLRAHALGMAQTQFYNASGLPNPGQVTTARDLSILARDIVVNYPQYQPFFEAINFNFNGRIIYSNNGMLKLYPGAMGMKTGYTILARHNLITAAQRNGTILIGVTLHEPSWGQTYTQMTAMLDTGFGGHVPGNNAILMANNQTGGPTADPEAASRMMVPVPSMQVASAQPTSRPTFTPPVVPLPQPSGPSLFPVADAATLQPPSHLPAHGWTAQLGSYSKMRVARQQALNVHAMRGVGVARVARLDRHGKVLWAAQLADLTYTGAHATCHALAAHGDSCLVIAPQVDHFALRDGTTGGGPG
jgi:D-alanyl-D-alanine carboxypeptidase